MKHRNIFLTASIVLVITMTACGQSKFEETESESETESALESETEKKDEVKKEENNKDKNTSNQTVSTTKPSSGSASKPSSGSNTSTSMGQKPVSGNNISTQKPETNSSNTTTQQPSSAKPSTGNSNTVKPSVSETEAPHVHNWVEVTHVEDHGCEIPIYGELTYMGVSCNGCGAIFDSVYGWENHDSYMIDEYRDYGHGGYTEVWDNPILGYEWVEDLVTISDGWRCSTCGETK